MEHSHSSSGWTCGSCERRVPRHIDECRCGFRRTEAATDYASVPGVEGGASGSGGRGLWLLLLGLAGGAALAMLPMRSVVTTASEPPTRDVPTQQTLASGAPEEPLPPAPAASSAIYPPDAPLATISLAAPNPAPMASLEDIVSRVVPAVASIVAGDA